MRKLEDDSITGTLGEVKCENKTDVYLHYDFSKYGEKSTKLPVYNYRKDVSILRYSLSVDWYFIWVNLQLA